MIFLNTSSLNLLVNLTKYNQRNHFHRLLRLRLHPSVSFLHRWMVSFFSWLFFEACHQNVLIEVRIYHPKKVFKKTNVIEQMYVGKV